jgi:hypothetical protein
MRSVSLRLAALAGLAFAAAAPAQAATNVIPGHWTSGSTDGVAGVLRAGAPWGPGSTPSDLEAPVDGAFAPENQQWNNGSFWWDEDATINAAPVHYTIVLDGLFTLNRFLVQADDNDSYLLEWWDGAAWQTAFNIAAVNTFGLVTRDSGVIGAITTDRLRFSATGGDAYYAVAEIQAFAVPEPATWGLMLAGFGVAGAALRHRRNVQTAS